MRRVSTVLIGGLVLAWLGLVGATSSAQNPVGNPEAKKIKNPVKATPDSIAAGEKLYQKNCNFCHGTEGKGDGKLIPKDTHPSDLTDAKWDRGSTDGEIFTTIQDGTAPDFQMKGQKGKMSDADIWNLVNYVRSLGPKNAK